MRQAVAAVHLRQRHADREPHPAPDPDPSAGAGQGARHRATVGTAFRKRRGADRAVLAEPGQGARPAGTRSVTLGAALYLGSAKVEDLETDAEIVAINRKGELEPHQRAILSDIEGIVLLDGTWSQAKALWWRNAWMLKCQRVILGPKRPSLYGRLRREPRRDGLSTIEAAAILLAGLEKRPDIAATLSGSFERMLARFREVQAKLPELAPKPKKRDFRRRRR
ncbi:hypothetical protein ACVIIY_004811 [Bradyrhizobium sp. USDA 4515]